MAAVILNGKKHAVLKTEKASTFLKSNGYALKAESITINGAKVAVKSCDRYYLRSGDSKDTIIEVK